MDKSAIAATSAAAAATATTSNDEEVSITKIKKENLNDDIKEFAETAMNELLGWYGYGSAREDTKKQVVRTTKTTTCRSRSDSNSSTPESPKFTEGCGWCGKPVDENNGLTSAAANFCSELCFTQSRRASFKKNKTCDWCRHVRHTVSYVDSQDGASQLQFCSDKCLNQYKMQIFWRETREHLDCHPQHLIVNGDESTSGGGGGANNDDDGTLITPDLWLTTAKSKSPATIVAPVDGDDAPTTPHTAPMPLITVAPPSKLMPPAAIESQSKGNNRSSSRIMRHRHHRLNNLNRKKSTTTASTTTTCCTATSPSPHQHQLDVLQTMLVNEMQPQDLRVLRRSPQTRTTPPAEMNHQQPATMNRQLRFDGLLMAAAAGNNNDLAASASLLKGNNTNAANSNKDERVNLLTPPLNPRLINPDYFHHVSSSNNSINNNSNQFGAHSKNFFDHLVPPPTVLVPYPIVLPLPIPIPIPIPIPNSLFAASSIINKRNTMKDAISQTTDVDFSLLNRSSNNNASSSIIDKEMMISEGSTNIIRSQRVMNDDNGDIDVVGVDDDDNNGADDDDGSRILCNNNSLRSLRKRKRANAAVHQQQRTTTKALGKNKKIRKDSASSSLPAAT